MGGERKDQESKPSDTYARSGREPSFVSKKDLGEPRYFNWSTWKYDLTETQAQEQERRRQLYNRAVDEELERRRQQRFGALEEYTA